MAGLAELQRELAKWETTLAEREKDEARRVVQAQRARRRAVRHRGDTVYADRNRRARERLAASRRGLHRAQAAVSKKRRQIAEASKPEGRAATLDWCKRHLYVTEQPAGSNRDNRKDGITHWQVTLADGGMWLVGKAWCGTFAGNGLRAGGVKNVTSRVASVALIEDDARAGSHCFSSWSSSPWRAWPGDLVVLFGRGVHVEVVRAVGKGVLYTYGGNTSSGVAGSQSNGGGSYPRVRAFNDVHGIAHVRY